MVSTMGKKPSPPDYEMTGPLELASVTAYQKTRHDMKSFTKSVCEEDTAQLIISGISEYPQSLS